MNKINHLIEENISPGWKYLGFIYPLAETHHDDCDVLNMPDILFVFFGIVMSLLRTYKSKLSIHAERERERERAVAKIKNVGSQLQDSEI